jgi:hypothetical protein
MPGPPREKSYNQDTPQGPITFTAAVVDRPHASFMVAWASVPPKLPFDFGKWLDTLRDRYQGEVKEKRLAEKDGQPGLAFLLDTRKPPGQAVGRLYHVKDRLYQLLVVGSKVEGSTDEDRIEGTAEVKRFFDTFKILNPLMKPETTAHD